MNYISITGFIVLSCILGSAEAMGQYGQSIRSGRPGQSIGVFTVGAKTFQVQTGVNSNELENGNITSWGTVLRQGLSERLEASAVLSYDSRTLDIGQESVTTSGLSDSQIGLRYHILDQDGLIPALGIQGRALLKMQSKEFQREEIGAKFLLATGHKLSDKFSFVTNWGLVWNGNDPEPSSLYILNLSYSVSPKVGTFVEMYGGLDPTESHFDAGLSFLVNDDLQLDLSGGHQGEPGITDWFADIGVSWRIDWR